MRVTAPILFIILAAVVFSASNPNQLTQAEMADGWILLYDGESAFGWTPEGGAQWATDPDGDFVAKAGESGDMVMNTVFGDFLLTCEMKAAAGKGSGLVVNGVTIPSPKIGDKWHSYSIRSIGGKVIASLDGKKIFEQESTQPGTVALHYRTGDSVRYHGIKLRPAGLSPLFNGHDLGGWRAVQPQDSKMPAEWSVKDGSIHVERGPGELETDGAYKDFVLQLEARANSTKPRSHPNSGVFLRGDPGSLRSGYESQILNDFEDEDRAKPVDFGTGGIYHHQPARRIIANDNEFFTKTVVARGRHFAVWVNGTAVTDWDDPNPEGKIVGNKEARLHSGPIGLEAHDALTNLDFRNIRIVELK